LSLPLIRLANGRTNGTAHYGVLLSSAEPVTACGTLSPDLGPIGQYTAHQMCPSCTRALLVLTTAPHPGGELDLRLAAGSRKGAVAHCPVPGHLLGYCGKPFDTRAASTRGVCVRCTRLGEALNYFQRRVGELLLPAGESCHNDDSLLWAPRGRSNLVTGHRRNVVTGHAYCEQPLANPNPGACHECVPCRRHGQEANGVRQSRIRPRARERARWWPQRRELDVFDDRACALTFGDAYTLSGCEEIHHVVTVADRCHESHIDLLVYLPAQDHLADLRVRRDRLVTIQRPR
jgi:hypothetical protein